ncbi:circularly permuted type 2 ATP-grasp protein [Nitriliruptoraceae bacterium ZYF776]|nr:circularly permuted type 2 ATP-grasp protein [Profundirhabdus halotolerans]
MGDLLSSYDRGDFFDEVVDDDGEIRPHYRALVDRLRDLTPDELERRERIRDGIFRTQGITFTVYGDPSASTGRADDEGTERTFPMDLLPRIIPAQEWEVVERGVAQRVTALNRFLEDLYVGEQAAIHDGVVPRWLVHTAEGFRREAFGIPVPHAARCLVSGVDLVRDREGTYRVLEDNLRNPSGISYVLENRAAMTRVLPVAFSSQRVRPVDHYGPMLLRALRAVAPPAAGEHPRAVVLTPGVHNSAYFEHAFLARQMGIELVEGRDLVVDEHVVYLRSTSGLRRVDVIYRRIDDDFLDPVVFRPDSALGVPGLLSAARAGNVTLANAVGNGVADDKAVYAFVPDLIRFYLGEEPILPNVETYLLWDAEQRREVLDRLDQLVVKPVAASGGYGMLIGPAAGDEEIARFRARIEADPRAYIAQEVVSLSRHPTVVDGNVVEGRHVDLRPFAIAGETVDVVPGGLTRVALRRGSLVVNSSQGGGSKDTWVLDADGDGVGAQPYRPEST